MNEKILEDARLDDMQRAVTPTLHLLHWTAIALSISLVILIGVIVHLLPDTCIFVAFAGVLVVIASLFSTYVFASGILPAIVVGSFVIIGIVFFLMPHVYVTMSLVWLEWFIDLIHFPFNSSKTGHMLWFACFTTGLLWLVGQRFMTLAYLLLVVCVVAASSESLQTLVSTRSASVRDLWFDSFGVMAGFAVFGLKFVRREWRNPSS